jgi:hypothetical protein
MANGKLLGIVTILNICQSAAKSPDIRRKVQRLDGCGGISDYSLKV